MDDATYAARLAEILQHPEVVPPRPPGTVRPVSPIDRMTGFGEDTWVERVSVDTGEHGTELVVEFGCLTGPPSAPETRRGRVGLPGDQAWRALSGYEHPEHYASSVAHDVERTARELLAPPRPPRDVVGVEEAWALLVDGLELLGAVRQTGPGRIELDLDGGDHMTVVVTPEQWQEVWRDEGPDDLDILLHSTTGPRDRDETFLVVWRGRLTRSVREELPPVRGLAQLRDLESVLRRDPDARPAWWAYAPHEHHD